MRGLAAAVLLALGAGCLDSAASEEVSPYLLTVGGSHVCAKRRAGLYCWGNNSAGQLGDGTTTTSELPVRAAFDVSDVVEIAAAADRTCLRRSSGTIACWGENDAGQIGDGTRSASLLPLTAAGISDARALAADARSTCALRADGSVACWGNSPAIQPESGSLVPQPIAGLREIVELRAGAADSYCARARDGSVQCIRVRDGAWTAPLAVEALAGASEIAMTAADEVCAILPGRDILCSHLDSSVTVSLAGSSGATKLRASGAYSACAMDARGQWQSWLLLPGARDSLAPNPAAVSDVPLVDMGISGFLLCALRQDDGVVCASANSGPPALELVEGLPP
jgi:hypothetical protein